MATFAELKASVDAYVAASEAAIAQAKVDVDARIDAAIMADDAGEEVDFGLLRDDVDAAFDRISPSPPVIEEPVPAPEPVSEPQ